MQRQNCREWHRFNLRGGTLPNPQRLPPPTYLQFVVVTPRADARRAMVGAEAPADTAAPVTEKEQRPGPLELGAHVVR
jgi:hypothetical protein